MFGHFTTLCMKGLINFTLGSLSNFWIAMSNGLVDSTGSSLNLASSLFMPSLLAEFSKKVLNIFAAFASFERSSPYWSYDALVWAVTLSLKNGLMVLQKFLLSKVYWDGGRSLQKIMYLSGDIYDRVVWSRLRTKSRGISWSNTTREISRW